MLGQLNDALLGDFADTFYGYGNYEAPYWFVGIEEGGGNDCNDIAIRLDVWQCRGRHEVEDLAAFHDKIKIDRFFADPVKSQTTWNKLIRILLSSKGVTTDLRAVKEYQSTKLGRSTGETCLIELLPLPSPSTAMWLLAQWTVLPQLKTKKGYEKYYTPRRANHIKQRIIEYKPRVVVFYGVDPHLLTWWQHIAGTAFSLLQVDGVNVWIAQGESTLFVITMHPAAKGLKNTYVHEVGALIANRLAVGSSQ